MLQCRQVCYFSVKTASEFEASIKMSNLEVCRSTDFCSEAKKGKNRSRDRPAALDRKGFGLKVAVTVLQSVTSSGSDAVME